MNDIKNRVKTILVVGAGPAGARVSRILAAEGYEVKLFDYRAPWEKPCGGGLTAKVPKELPDIKMAELKTKEHRRVHIVFPHGRRVGMTLQEPIMTVSREELGSILIGKAIDAGADYMNEKVLSVEHVDPGWSLTAENGKHYGDFLVGAEGVNGVVRRAVADPFPPEDICLTYGKIIEGPYKMPLAVRFFKDFRGYAWIFPRRSGTAVGIGTQQHLADREDMLDKLRGFVAEEFVRNDFAPPELDGGFGWMIPALRPETFETQKPAGEDWALIGDASGTADPLTGEGVYQALVTARLLANAFRLGQINNYNVTWTQMTRPTVAKVSRAVDRFYNPRSLRIMGLALDYSPAARRLGRDLMGDSQDYMSLKNRVKFETLRYILEATANLATGNRGERRRKKKKRW